MKTKGIYSLKLKDAFAVSEPAGAPCSRANTVDYRALIEWQDGVPCLVSVPVRISEKPENALRALLRKCLDLPYDGSDPSLRELSQGEAMVVSMTRQAADGDNDARTSIIDRLLGRPQQNIKSVSLSGDLNEFLDKIAAETKFEAMDITPGPVPDNSVEDL